MKLSETGILQEFMMSEYEPCAIVQAIMDKYWSAAQINSKYPEGLQLDGPELEKIAVTAFISEGKVVSKPVLEVSDDPELFFPATWEGTKTLKLGKFMIGKEPGGCETWGQIPATKDGQSWLEWMSDQTIKNPKTDSDGIKYPNDALYEINRRKAHKLWLDFSK